MHAAVGKHHSVGPAGVCMRATGQSAPLQGRKMANRHLPPNPASTQLARLCICSKVPDGPAIWYRVCRKARKLNVHPASTFILRIHLYIMYHMQSTQPDLNTHVRQHGQLSICIVTSCIRSMYARASCPSGSLLRTLTIVHETPD